MLFSQVPGATTDQLLTVIIGVAAVAGIIMVILRAINEYRTLTHRPDPPPPPPPSPGQELVMRMELEGHLKLLDGRLSSLSDKQAELSSYTSRSVRELTDLLHQHGLRMEAMRVEIRQDLDHAFDKLVSRTDQNAIVLARLDALLEDRKARRQRSRKLLPPKDTDS